MDYTLILFVLACVIGFTMATGIGANDVANAMGTSVGSGALTIKQAIIIAAIFEAAGAILAGGQVTHTLSEGIIQSDLLASQPELVAYGMLAALCSATLWLFIASYFGWPVSTTHTIVGAVIGFGAVGLGVQAIIWSKITTIILSWLLTPIIAGVLAYLLFESIQRLILRSDSPLESAKRFAPFYVLLMTFILSMVTVLKGLQKTDFHPALSVSIPAAIGFSILITLLAKYWMHRLTLQRKAGQSEYVLVERVFGLMMLFTACAMAFAHGSNDVANAIGPLATIINMTQNNMQYVGQSAIPLWILFLGASGIVLGLAVYGHKVIATIGKGITELTPTRGFAANLATASTVIIASGTGLPISTTQTLVGAVLGVGIARGIGALNLKVIRNIFMSWAITLPAGALFSLIFFQFFRMVFP